jgi:biopolymer transport protein ExbD
VLTEEQTPLDFNVHAPQSGLRIMVAPLIDTVLFLIWFYLIVGQLVIHQKDASIQLPRMASPLSMQEAPAELVLNLRSDGSVTVNGKAAGTDQLKAVIAEEIAKAAVGEHPVRVVVRADRRQSFGRLEEVLRLCRDAGLAQVVFRAEQGAGL